MQQILSELLILIPNNYKCHLETFFKLYNKSSILSGFESFIRSNLKLWPKFEIKQ